MNEFVILHCYPCRMFNYNTGSMQCGADCYCVSDNGDIYDCEFLYSYNTLVAGTINGKVFTRGYYSNTTSKHQNKYFKNYCNSVPVDFDKLSDVEQSIVLWLEHNRDYSNTNNRKRG